MKSRNLFKLGILVLGVIFLVNLIGPYCRSVLARENKEPIRVILIGWDGVQRNHLIDILKDESIITEQRVIGRKEIIIPEPLPQQDFLPNLKEVISKGFIIKMYITEDTATKAGWAQILTGYNADVTGVYSNAIFKEIPDGYSIFGRLHKKFGPNKPISEDNVYNLMVTGKGHHIGTLEYQGKKEPFFIEKKYLDFQATDESRTNFKVFELADRGLRRYVTSHKDEHLFAFIHFRLPDTFGHNFSEGSLEYRYGIELCDYYTGKIFDVLKELDIYEDTLIYITTDHGFDESSARYPTYYRIDKDTGQKQTGISHALAPYIFLATNHKAVIRSRTSGNRNKVAPTILEDFGVDLDDPDLPPLSGKPLTKVNQPEGRGNPESALKPREVQKILLISWSGANRTRLKDMLNNDQLPNLKRLYQTGRLVDIDITHVSLVRGSDPVAGTACLTTGYLPELTGCFNHNRIEASLPEGYTIFERLEKFFGRRKRNSNIVTALLMGEDDGRCRHLIDEGAIDNIDKIFVNAQDDIDVYKTHLLADSVGDEAVDLLNDHSDERLFAFIHFVYPDIAGHTYGEGSEKYKEALKKCDDELGRIISTLEGMQEYNKTLIYVTATNGFENQDALAPFPQTWNNPQGYSHRMSSYVFLATNDAAVKRHGLQIDIASTILPRFGVLLRQVYPVFPGRRLNYKWNIWDIEHH